MSDYTVARDPRPDYAKAVEDAYTAYREAAISTYTHADLLAAVDARRKLDDPAIFPDAEDQAAHLDTLRAILDLHLVSDYCCDVLDEPVCPTVQVVADALRKMGALT